MHCVCPLEEYSVLYVSVLHWFATVYFLDSLAQSCSYPVTTKCLVCFYLFSGYWSIIYSFIHLSNCFILVRVMVDMKPIPINTVQLLEMHMLDGMLGHCSIIDIVSAYLHRLIIPNHTSWACCSSLGFMSLFLFFLSWILFQFIMFACPFLS